MVVDFPQVLDSPEMLKYGMVSLLSPTPTSPGSMIQRASPPRSSPEDDVRGGRASDIINAHRSLADLVEARRSLKASLDAAAGAATFQVLPHC